MSRAAGRWSKTLVATCGILATAAPAARAQNDSVSGSVRVWVNGDELPQDRLSFFTTRRARLGVTINMRARATDSIGAYVNGVTPGGPAAQAGIRSGDIIIRLDGQALVGSPALGAEGQSAPGLKLVELAARLAPGDTIAVEYRRGTMRRTTRLVTGDEPVVVYGFDSLNNPLGPQGGAQLAELERRQMGMMSAPGMTYKRMPMGGFRFSFGLADLELAPVNPDLGRYFGVTEGVLVIDVPDSSTLNLMPGDVVLSVAGRPTTMPGQVLRILQSYDTGDEIRFEVMRMKKKETIVGHLSADGEMPRHGPPPADH
jgi:membrane-associated protease RseP (regulator of RpoE activity)